MKINIKNLLYLPVITFPVIFSIFYSCSNSCDCTELSDKKGIMYLADDSIPYTGQCEENFSGVKKSYFYKKGKLHGVYSVFNEKGKKVFETHYNEGKKRGNRKNF